MHAHRKLAVHLDLKPSNILVTSDGTPKLLDANETEGSQPITILGAMTPEYASPEQIKGEPLTTADIYSLGVVLFKILTGSYPYDFKGKTNGNLLKEITDSEPFRPSAVAGAAADRERINSMLNREKYFLTGLRKFQPGNNQETLNINPVTDERKLKSQLSLNFDFVVVNLIFYKRSKLMRLFLTETILNFSDGFNSRAILQPDICGSIRRLIRPNMPGCNFS